MTTPLPAPVVQLRVPTDEDALNWHRVFDDPEVMEFHGGAPAELSVYEELTARQRRHDAERGFCLWTLLDGDGEVIGFTGAQPWPHESFGPVGEIEIGWRLGRTHWGRGYATAAARATLARVRAAGVGRVVAMVNTRNERSVSVTRRLGMELVETYPFTSRGTEQQAYCFGLEL
ncbi:GNAT family N-acetyltransferase [Streptomyces sp. NPDC055025]